MKLVIATRNPKKLAELQRMLEKPGVQLLMQSEVCPQIEVEETGDTFMANARLKARAIADATGLAAVADDSGLCVDALDGAPGVYTARFGGEDITQRQRNALLLSKLDGLPWERRTARFVSAICCVLPDKTHIETFGECEGYVGYRPAGENGFGYDPIFYIDEATSFAMLSDAQKDEISHRGGAMRAFARELKERIKTDDYK